MILIDLEVEMAPAGQVPIRARSPRRSNYKNLIENKRNQ